MIDFYCNHSIINNKYSSSFAWVRPLKYNIYVLIRLWFELWKYSQQLLQVPVFQLITRTFILSSILILYNSNKSDFTFVFPIPIPRKMNLWRKRFDDTLYTKIVFHNFKNTLSICRSTLLTFLKCQLFSS